SRPGSPCRGRDRRLHLEKPLIPCERFTQDGVALSGLTLRGEDGQGLFLPFPGTNSPPKRNGARRRGLSSPVGKGKASGDVPTGASRQLASHFPSREEGGRPCFAGSLPPAPAC